MGSEWAGTGEQTPIGTPAAMDKDGGTRMTRPAIEPVTYGIHADQGALDPQPAAVAETAVARAVRDDRRLGELRALAEVAGVPVATIEEAELAALADGGRHQARLPC